jgi:hypothetical protein
VRRLIDKAVCRHLDSVVQPLASGRKRQGTGKPWVCTNTEVDNAQLIDKDVELRNRDGGEAVRVSVSDRHDLRVVDRVQGRSAIWEQKQGRKRQCWEHAHRIDNALRVARQATGRPGIPWSICYED